MWSTVTITVIAESKSNKSREYNKSREQRAESTAIVSVVSEYAVTYQLHISYVSVA